MDKVQLGQRLADARDLAGMTQESVARAVGLDRTAIVLLEKGERNLKVPELVEIARVLGRPLAYFVDPPVPAAVSRRAAPGSNHDSTRMLDVELEQFASDIRGLLRLDLVKAVTRDPTARTPRTHMEAEGAAERFRRDAGLASDPIDDLGRVCEHFGLYVFAAAMGVGGPDGGCVEVDSGAATAGAAVINGDAGSGRRRMTAAHELGHWLFGDAYDTGATSESEQMINSFAIHFLAPRAGVIATWSKDRERTLRDRAMSVGVTYRLSWSATIAQLRNLDLISTQDRDRLSIHEPRAGDYLRLGMAWRDEFQAPYLSPAFVAGCLDGYVCSRITQARVLELLRGIVSAEQLPHVEPASMGTLRSAFEGHPLTHV